MGNRMKFNELGRKKSVEQLVSMHAYITTYFILHNKGSLSWLWVPSRGDLHSWVPGAPLWGSNYRLTCTQWTPAEGISIPGSWVPHCGDQTTDWHVPNEPQQRGSPFLGPWCPTVGIKLQTDMYPMNPSRGDLHSWVPGAPLWGSNYRLTCTQWTPAEGISIPGSLVPHCGDQTKDWHVLNEPQQSGSPFLGPWCPTVGIKLQTDMYPMNPSRGDLHFWVPGAPLSGSNYRLTCTQWTPAKQIFISGSPVPNCQDQTTNWWVPSQHQQSGSPFLGPQYPTVRIKLQTDGYPANTSRVNLHFWVPGAPL